MVTMCSRFVRFLVFLSLANMSLGFPCSNSSRSGPRSKIGGCLPIANLEEKTTAILASPLDDFDKQRRNVWRKSITRVASATIGLTALTLLTRPVWGANSKSRTDGYSVQKTEDEWKSVLSPMQYFILREGGTERPGFSILEKEKRPGTYSCAGCGSALFSSADKFNSRTGWPSFSRGLDAVEVEDVSVLTASLGGAELRCATCGGHLGDVFSDGFLFPGTPAALTGKRFCIDGGALVFEPDEPFQLKLRGDSPAPPKALPSFLESPRIEPRD